MEILGKSPINSFIYVTGKFASYLCWMSVLVQFLGLNLRWIPMPAGIVNAAFILAAAGLAIGLIAMSNLGSALRFGIPTTGTELKTGGFYSIIRNPIYVGFNILTIASVFYTANPLILALAVYGIYTLHLIVLAEEKFLKGRFGKEYEDYCKKVRRYI